MSLTCWQTLLNSAFSSTGDTWDDIVYTTLTPEDLIQEFDCSWGGAEGVPFTLWTENFVYFPAEYDGSEWVSWVPRNPCDIKSRHVGGG